MARAIRVHGIKLRRTIAGYALLVKDGSYRVVPNSGGGWVARLAGQADGVVGPTLKSVVGYIIQRSAVDTRYHDVRVCDYVDAGGMLP